MKNKILKGIALGIITTLVIACQPKKEETATATVVDKEAIKAELQTMETAFADAMNEGKPESIVYYSDDVISYDQDAPPLMGKKAVNEKLTERAKTTPKGTKVTYTANEVFPSVDGNQVVELGSYKVVDSTGAAKSSGNYMSLFERRDGKYICIRDMGASDMVKKEEKK